eukprot:6187286-Pleurochrysis_carterae.AAC.1
MEATDRRHFLLLMREGPNIAVLVPAWVRRWWLPLQLLPYIFKGHAPPRCTFLSSQTPARAPPTRARLRSTCADPGDSGWVVSKH